jgi:hypothetical protein
MTSTSGKVSFTFHVVYSRGNSHQRPHGGRKKIPSPSQDINPSWLSLRKSLNWLIYPKYLSLSHAGMPHTHTDTDTHTHIYIHIHIFLWNCKLITILMIKNKFTSLSPQLILTETCTGCICPINSTLQSPKLGGMGNYIVI